MTIYCNKIDKRLQRQISWSKPDDPLDVVILYDYQTDDFSYAAKLFRLLLASHEHKTVNVRFIPRGNIAIFKAPPDLIEALTKQPAVVFISATTTDVLLLS